MPRNKQLLQHRNRKIAKDFKSLCEQTTKSGKPKYSYEYMLEKLSERFFLDKQTISKILKK